MPKPLPKGTKWGEEDDDVVPSIQQQSVPKKKAQAEAPAAPIKKIPLELAANSTRSIVKEFMIGENKATATNALKQISTENDKEFFSSFVASLSAQSFGGTKPKKLVASLLLELSAAKANILSNEVIVEGLTRTLEQSGSGADADKLAALKDIFVALQEANPGFLAIELRDAGAKLRDDQKNQNTGGANDVDAVAREIYSSPSAAEGLVKAKELAFNKMSGSGLAFLRAVLKDAKLDDATCAWVEKNAKTLGFVLFTAAKADQLQALEAIQAAFNAIGFPKASNGAIIDSVFTRMYSLDILPDTAFIAWKDDLSLNTPGRNTAIIQTTRFFGELEEQQAEEYDDDEE
jgi:hypothetical protein